MCEETSSLLAQGLLLLGRTGVDKAANTVKSPSSLPRGQACFFLSIHPALGTTALNCAVAMGLAGRAVGALGVLRGAPLPCLWRLLLLFFFIWELDAQTAVETKPMYIWQTGTVHPLFSFPYLLLLEMLTCWMMSHSLLHSCSLDEILICKCLRTKQAEGKQENLLKVFWIH